MLRHSPEPERYGGLTGDTCQRRVTSGSRQTEGVASRIQEYPPASVAGLMVRFGRAEFEGELFHRIEVVSAEIQVEVAVYLPRSNSGCNRHFRYMP
jgi:hypothetical protein